MPQRKKAKTSHQRQAVAGNQADHTGLSHDEIWDDSALIRSWDAAVKEYEYYHSLAAQGLDVDAILDEAESADANGEPLPLGLDGAAVEPTSNGAENTTAHADDGDAEEGEIDDEEDGPAIGAGDGRPPTAEEKQAALRRAGLLADGLGDGASGGALKVPASANDVPAQLPSDQTLENVKMAYYWAGYYSGLYDGQRQSTSANGQLTGVSGVP